MTIDGGLRSALVSLTSKDLRFFTAVAETLNFHEAANALFVSQPSLSKQVRTTEEKLGVRLFERTTRSVRLTPEGQIAAPLARALLAGVEASIAMARGEGRRPGAIRLLHCAEGSGQAASFAPQLHQADPEVEVHVHEVRADELNWPPPLRRAPSRSVRARCTRAAHRGRPIRSWRSFPKGTP